MLRDILNRLLLLLGCERDLQGYRTYGNDWKYKVRVAS